MVAGSTINAAVAALLLASLAQNQSENLRHVAPEAASRGDVITVTGEREEEVAPSGSRIARPKRDRGYQQVASDTGVAGLTPGSGMDPFAGPTRRVEIKECRSDNEQLSKASVCALAKVQEQMQKGEWALAMAGADRVLTEPASTDVDKYFAARHLYRIAEMEGSDDDRSYALRQMLRTSIMPEAERRDALASLVALSLKNGETDSAISDLEALVKISPTDARSRGNLAALYSQAGRKGEALKILNEAIAIMRSEGTAVPPPWLQFVADESGN